MIIKELELLFIWFVIYSVLGWIYESIYCSITQRRLVNRGFLNGPLCPIYGMGAILDICVLGEIQNPILLFAAGAVLACALEYLTSYLLEKLFHARWWDYKNMPMNLNGRICFLGAVVFGMFAVILNKWIHPWVRNWTNRLPIMGQHILACILFVVILVDIIVTIRGLVDFAAKLKAISEDIAEHMEAYVETQKQLLTEQKLLFSEQINEFRGEFWDRLTRQQKRMIKAFPALQSIPYHHALTELKEHARELRKRIRDHK